MTMAADTGVDLFGRYAPGAFAFATGERAMLCSGGVPVPGLDRPGGLGEAVRTALDASAARGEGPAGAAGPAGQDGSAAARRPLAVGAIPFDTRRPAHLVIPQSVRTAPPLHTASAPLHAAGPSSDAQPQPAQRRFTDNPGREGHLRAVERGLAELRADPDLDKLVLARTLETDGDGLAPERVLCELAARHPRAYVFAAPLPGDGGGPGGRTLVGASPELLVSLRGGTVRTCPLAGSAARSDDQAEDERRAAALLASGKDRFEHEVVVEEIARALGPLCRDLDVPSAPVLTSTPSMWHLATPITATVADPATSSVDLALALHPTPAICGRPAVRAREAIGRIEQFDRGFYTGLVGWCDSAGDGEWAIAIRCAEMTPQRVRLFAGGGIVAGSDPHSELAETTAKFRTMTAALSAAAH